MITKKCSKCCEIRTTDEFHKNKRNKDGLQVYCKVCRKKTSELNKEILSEYKKKWYLNNSEKIKKRINENYHNKKDEINSYRREKYLNDIELHKLRRQKYYDKNKDKIIENNKKWAKNNREKVEDMLKDIPGKIIIKEFSAGRASLGSVETHLDKLQHNHDFLPDMIIIDYLDLLKNRNHGRKNVHDDIDDIYVDARGLARERGLPLLSPSQMGRAGANDDITDPTKIGGSYKKLMICDFGVGLARKRKDKINGTGKFTVLANRHGGDGMVFKATLDTSNGNIEIDEEQMVEDDDDFKEAWRDAKSIDKDDKEYLKEKFYKN